MKKITAIINFIVVFCLTVCAILISGVSFFTTVYYEMHDENDHPFYKPENIPLLLISMAVVFIVFFVLYKKNFFMRKKTFFILGLIFVSAYCMMLILAIKPQAVNDSKLLDNVINAFAAGDYTSLTQPGGYLFTWPFQLGYVGFGQIMVRFFGQSNYFAWDIAQLISILVTMLLIYLMTDELFEDAQVSAMAAFLSLGALFFYNYVTYIYGDILSMAPQTLALYMMVLFIKRKKPVYGLVSGVAIACAVLLKTNCEITLIALIAILILGISDEPTPWKGTEFRKALRLRLGLAALFVVLTFGAKAGVDSYFRSLTGIDRIPDGNPATAHIAMGLQESELENGWYNGYNYKVFKENNYDSEATSRAAVENIKARLSEFRSDPGYGIRFFLRKFSTQWADPVCISTHNLDLVSRHVEDQPPLCDFIVFGKGSVILRWIMNVFMSVCYLCVLIFLVTRLVGKKVTTPQMLVLILIFGGILFHEFWEGSSRYAMRYYIYWLPFAACGMKVLLGHFYKHGKR